MISESIRRRWIIVGEVSYKGHRYPAERRCQLGWGSAGSGRAGAGCRWYGSGCGSQGTVNLRSCGRSAISLIRHTRPGESRRRTGENRPRIAQVDSARLRIPDRQIVGDDGSKVAGLRGTGSPAQNPRPNVDQRALASGGRCCAATATVNADTSSRAETKGRSHRQIDARDPGRGGRS